MAEQGHKREKKAQEMLQILIVVNVFHYFNTYVAAVESHGQAFIQTDNELRYTVDGALHVIPGQNIEDVSFHDYQSSPLRFEPPLLDFLEQPVGMPHMEQVTVQNPDAQNSLLLLSISGSTAHFHCSFFQDKLVPPGGNTTFEVVFLARQVGNVENTLYIHTSKGSYKYQVFGVGVANPYRIRPFLEAKIPLNYSFSPLIQLHNPHGSTLQVEEIYTSGGDLHLELPTGENEATRDFWEIPPYETKPIMKASFIGRVENNHTAFIRIKTNKEKKDKVLILPVEVEVTSAPGIYSPLEMLDFGILRTLDEPKIVKLNLINSGVDPVYITNLTVHPPNSAINIEFRPVKLSPNDFLPTQVASISFTASKAVSSKQWTGRIIVKTKNSQYKLSIPYQSTVLHGSLVYDRNKTMFYTGDPNFTNETRSIPITNTFNFTLVIYNVTVPVDVQNNITVNLSQAVLLPPGKSVSPFTITVHPKVSHLHLRTRISLHTNASVFHIPIYIYNGRLKVVHHRPEIFKGQLDFGTLGMEEKRSMTFTLRNDNPVDIVIREFGANMDKTLVDFLGIEKGNGTTLTRKHNTSEYDTNPLVLKPFHYAVFSVDLVAPDWEGTFAAEVIIVTQYENLYIPMTLRTAEGSMTATPEKVVFEKCFPGKLSSRDLKIHSSFSQYMEVRAITFSPNDTRFFYVPPQQRAVVLEPNRDNLIGKIYFDPKRECGEDCYVGLPTFIPAGHHWLLGTELNREVADTDQYLYTRFRQKWDNLGLSQTSTINVTIQLDTNQVRGFLFPAQAHLHWPSLTKKSRIKFPLTQIGNTSISDFIVENPGEVPVIMQILPFPYYPNPQTILDMVSSTLGPELSNQYIEMNDHDTFILPDLEDYNTSPNNPVPRFRNSIKNSLGVQPHEKTIALVVAGGSKVRVRVGFQPKDDLPRTTLILIRNNMTILDTVVVQGQGGRGELKFGNKKSGLLFEMTEKHLKNCDKKRQNKNIPPNFTVKKSFTAKNSGQLPFYVHSFSINDSPCEGYGFKIIECQGFELQPNSSKKIDIVFTPDFTMSRIRRTLTLHTSLGPAMNYTLQATVPASMLTKCAQALPRPTWEPILYYSAICIMGFLLFCILVASYFEADRIYTADIIKRRSKVTSGTQTFDKSKVFDLKAVAGCKAEVKAGGGKVGGELVNGHAKPPLLLHQHHHGPPGKRRKPSGMFGFLRGMFGSRGTSTTRTAHCPEQQSNHDNHSKDSSTSSKPPNSNNNHVSPPNGATGNHRQSTKPATGNNSTGTNSNASWSLLSLLPFLRRGRSNSQAAHSDDLTADTSNPGNNNGTTSSSNNVDIEKRKQDTDQTSLNQQQLNHGNGNKHRHQQQHQEADNKSTERGRRKDRVSMATTDTTTTTTSNGLTGSHQDAAATPFINIVDEDDDVTSGKKEGKRKQRKSNYNNKRMKEFKAAAVAAENEKDETSSNTTESSSLDADDKTYTPRDSTPEPQQPKTKKLKTKSKKDKSSKSSGKGNVAHEDEFIITSKSKAHTKIRVDPKNAFGGDIHEPSSLELPYTIKADSHSNNKRDSSSPPVHTNEKRRSRGKSNKNKGSSVFHPLRVNCDMASARDTESPPPNWDPPISYNGVGDLTDISLQTEMFAKHHGKGLNEPLSSSSRSSSYSSIVSNNSTGAGGKRYTTTGTPSPTDGPKSPNSGLSPITPGLTPGSHALSGRTQQAAPGAVGARTPGGRPGQTPGSGRSNPWNPNPGNTNPETQGNSFGLQPIAENLSGVMSGSEEPGSSMLFGLQNGLGQLSNFSNLQTGSSETTMMQTLLADRRRRTLAYQQKLLSGRDWPGFDFQMPHESLWDTSSQSSVPAPPSEPWSSLTGQTALWDTPVTSAAVPSSSWTGGTTSPGPGIWTQGTDPMPDIVSGTPGMDPAEGSPAPGGPAGNVGSFDPFNTLGNIWNPATTTSTSTTPNWRITAPEEDKN